MKVQTRGKFKSVVVELPTPPLGPGEYLRAKAVLHHYPSNWRLDEIHDRWVDAVDINFDVHPIYSGKMSFFKFSTLPSTTAGRFYVEVLIFKCPSKAIIGGVTTRILDIGDDPVDGPTTRMLLSYRTYLVPSNIAPT